MDKPLSLSHPNAGLTIKQRKWRLGNQERWRGPLQAIFIEWEVKVWFYSEGLLLQIYDNLITRLMIKSYLVGVGFLLNDDDIVLGYREYKVVVIRGMCGGEIGQ